LSKKTTTKTATNPRARPEAEPLDGDGWPEPEHAPLPTRGGPAAMLTPLRAGLLCLLIAAAGFIAGVLVQKGSGGSSSSNPFGSSGLPDLASDGAQGAGALGGGTMGTVSTVDHGTLYVSDSQGNTFKVLTTGATKVTRSADAKPGEIHPGDTVLIQGQQRKNGTVRAQSINAAAAGASTGFPGGGSAPGAGGANAGGGSGTVDQLFGN
jgi:Domain of unknown function (DUF5666)